MITSERVSRSAFAGLILAACWPPPARAEEVIDSPMYRTPALPKAVAVNTFPARLLPLWLEALGRPDADTRREAAAAIAAARARGMKGLEAAVGPLARELTRADQHPATRLAAARALVALDARDQADALLRAAADDAQLREVVEPALARWDHKPARAVWLERLVQAPPRRGTVLAVQALAAVREEKAVAPLRELVLAGEAPPAVRLEAARALAELRQSGSEADAARLAADATPRGLTGRLCAVTLLRRHAGDAAVRQLQALARDPEPAVAAVALTRLVEIDPKLVEPTLDAVLADADAGVRGAGVEAMFRRPGDEHLRRLGDRLADAHPDVRARARRALRDLAAKPQWKGMVIREVTRGLASDDWRALEQAALLAGQVDHKPAAGRLVELLSAGRPEVCVAAAWALRTLAVREMLPAVLDYFKRTVATGMRAGERKLPEETVDAQLSQLAQFMGQAGHRPAQDAFVSIIRPTQQAGFETRAAAIWALGYLHEGKPGADFAGLLAGRIRAVVPGDLEDARVRRMSAVALGVMKEKGELETLRRFYTAGKATLDPVINACGWAIEQITGEKLPPGTAEFSQINWFLVPIK